MPKPVFFIECSVPFWLDVAANLQERLGLEPIYWTGHHAFAPEVEKRFPGACFHSNLDAVRSIPAAMHADRILPPLDQTLLDDLARCERTALHMMQRIDPDESMAYTDRVRLHHRHLRYWLGMLDRYKPLAVFLPNSPHLVYDYVLYELCKRQSVPTVLFTESSVDGLVYPITDFENGSDELSSTYRQLRAKANYEPALTEWTQRYVSRVQGTYDQGLPAYVKNVYRETLPSLKEKGTEAAPSPSTVSRFIGALDPRPLLSTLWSRKGKLTPWRVLRYLRLKHQVPRDFDNLLEMLRKHGRYQPQALAEALYCTEQIYRGLLETFDRFPTALREPAPPSYFVQPGKVPERAGYTGLEFWAYRLMATKKKINLRAHYERLARPVDFTQPYIYHALHYQPEKSSCPEGDVFTNQFLAIDLLSKCAPPGWTIRVKEHPYQWEQNGSGELTRAAQFYDDAVALPNVQLVPQAYSPFDLIDHAQAVATVSGTSGWEAVVRGRPALVFGHAWYRACEGVFYTPTASTCREALRQIALGYKPDKRLVRVFLKALEAVSFRGCTIPDLADWAGVSPEESLKGFVQALENTLGTKNAA